MQLSLPLNNAQPARVFMPQKEPLSHVADWLLTRAQAHERVVDLQASVVVLPTARSGRRLLELLVDRAERKKRGLLPPRIVTPSGLLGLLVHPDGAPSPAALVRLAWVQALTAHPADTVLAFGSDGHALELASLCEKMDAELMGAGLSFTALSSTSPSGARYEALERLRLAAMQPLALDPRRFLTEGTLHVGALVLVGVVDLPPQLRKKLDPKITTAVILAPEHWRERFDAWGGLVKAPWVAAKIDVDDGALCFVATAREQAEAVVEFLAQDDTRSTRDVSVAIVDEEVTAPLEHALARAGAAAHIALPLPFLAQPVARLIQVAADYLHSADIDAFAALVRHPDLHLSGALASLDAYRAEHLPDTPSFQGDFRSAAIARDLVAQVDECLGELRGPPRALGAWGVCLLDFLARVYGGRALRPLVPDDKRLLDAINAVMRAVEALQPASDMMAAAEALRFVLSITEDEVIARDATGDAIELFGWLELPLDDAPVSVVVGCNEGKLPPSLNADAFLPNSVRRELGLADNDTRYARDAYVLTTLLRTRERLLLVAGRRSLVGDPLLPSRLLLACDGRTAAVRIEKFFSDHATPRALVATGFTLSPPLPDADEPVQDELPVTAFSDYLACPYRFYLKRVLRLRAASDTAREMSPMLSGNLLHAALQTFANDADEGRVSQIAQAMRDALWREAAKAFGPKINAALNAQIAQLELRLQPLAEWQARWYGEGWRIAHSELAFDGKSSPFLVDGSPIYLKGKIDRIDVHPDFGVTIFDYKTSESAQTPEERHQRRGEWVDLQLPLYRELWRLRGDARPVRLGYINVSKSPRDTRGALAPWNDADLAPAYDKARQVVRLIRERVFWPANPRAQGFQEFDWVCS